MAARATDSHSASVDPDEVAKFAALAGEWWDPAGKFAPLHRLNPARLTFIRDRIAAPRAPGRKPQPGSMGEAVFMGHYQRSLV